MGYSMAWLPLITRPPVFLASLSGGCAMDHRQDRAVYGAVSGKKGHVLHRAATRFGSSRGGLLLGCSLAALTIALGPVFAEDDGVRPQPSPSTLDAAGHPLTAADFRAWDAYNGDWGLGAINAAGAYARGFTGLDVPVAVIDSGIDPDHPKFAGRILDASRNFWTPVGLLDSTILFDPNVHGTHVSGTIGASPDGGRMMGVAFDSKILNLGAIISIIRDPDDPTTPSDAEVIKRKYGQQPTGSDVNGAVDYAAAKGARILNGSYGPSFSYSTTVYQEYGYRESLKEYDSLKRAADHDVLMVFAAGNEHSIINQYNWKNASGASLYPYVRPENAGTNVYRFIDRNGNVRTDTDFSSLNGYIISVVNIDRNRAVQASSNQCGVTANWCMSAPGTAILSTIPGGRYAEETGTSMAAPHVAGAAAVLRQAFPFLKAPEIAQTLFTTATHLGDGPADKPNDVYGWGLLNLGKAIDGPGQFTYAWTVDTTYNGQAYYGTFANDISGVGGLIKTGAGTLELSGTNTYAGGTSVYGGNLAVWRDANLGADGTGLTLGGGGWLRVLADDFSTARPVTLDGHGGLRIDTGLSTFVGVLADGAQPGSLTLTGRGTLRLTADNTYTGGTSVHGSILAVTRDANLGAAGGGLTLSDGGFLQIRQDGFTTTRPVTLDGLGVLGSNRGTASVFGGVIADGATSGRLMKVGYGTLDLTADNTYTGGTTIFVGTLAVTRDANLGAAGGGLSFANGGTLEVRQDGFSTARPATLDGRGGLRIDTGSSSFAGVIADGAQPGFLRKDGAGTAVLTAANTYTGGTTVAAGTLALTATGRLVSLVSVGPDGTFANAGLASGGVTNAGVLTTRGTIGGGLINTGTVTASAGRIDGAIRNDAGLVAVSGTVASTGTFANAAGATLAVAGAYSLSGPLTNAGTVTIARTASLTAPAGLGNAGSITNSGTITGGLTNAGWTRNTGTITGGVSNSGSLTTRGTVSGGLINTGTVLASAGRIDGAIRNDAGTLAVSGTVASDGALANAAGATLAVTGAYSLAGPLANAGTVALAQNASLSAPAGLGNAGLLISDGSLTTDLTNTGTARLAGRLDGALTNAGSLLFTGPLAGLTSLTNAGPLDLGGTALTLASLSGPASGVIANGALTVTGSASTAYAGAILQSTSPTSLTKAGPGTLKLTGTGRFSGPTTIQ
ncbi:S8 family serine peptidase, partial [Methylobacterium sp. SI9]|uniref:S8 family serine peptidase n=1 Tax=Methylobacterium guangdongense TaxID=3138811 RepID=UPI00313E9CCE